MNFNEKIRSYLVIYYSTSMLPIFLVSLVSFLLTNVFKMVFLILSKTGWPWIAKKRINSFVLIMIRLCTLKHYFHQCPLKYNIKNNNNSLLDLYRGALWLCLVGLNLETISALIIIQTFLICFYL